MTRILVVDNFDSFVYTLAGYLQELGAEVAVVRNDEVDASGTVRAVTRSASGTVPSTIASEW